MAPTAVDRDAMSADAIWAHVERRHQENRVLYLVVLGCMLVIGFSNIAVSCTLQGQHEEMLRAAARYEGAVRIQSLLSTIHDPAEHQRLRPFLLQSLDEPARVQIQRLANWDAIGSPKPNAAGVVTDIAGGPKQRRLRESRE
jgi:hypothetical protein